MVCWGVQQDVCPGLPPQALGDTALYGRERGKTCQADQALRAGKKGLK